MYSISEVAEKLSVSERTVRRMAQRGELSARKVGGQWRFPVAAVDRIEREENGKTHDH